MESNGAVVHRCCYRTRAIAFSAGDHCGWVHGMNRCSVMSKYRPEESLATEIWWIDFDGADL